MSHWHIPREQAAKARLAKAFGPKPERSVTGSQVRGGLRNAHAPDLQPLDRQAEQLKASLVRIGDDLAKAVAKGNTARRDRLARLLTNQQARLAMVLDRLAASPGFAPGTRYEAKVQDHTSYHPATGTKPQASKGRRVKLSKAERVAALERLEQAAASTARQAAIGRPKGTKA
jgi:hypothetical protein